VKGGPTSDEIRAGVQAVLVVSEAIRELGEVPSGHLYAQLMPAGISLETFGRIVGILRNAGLVEERGHLLRWVGPKLR
jgi:hypothetical protein